MERNNKLLITGKFTPYFPSINLMGTSGKWKQKPSYLGLSCVDFDLYAVNIMTVSTYETEDIDATVNVSVYEGDPSDSDIADGKICVSGIIEVGKKNISIDGDYSGEMVIPWPEGETAVMVMLNNDEVSKGEIRNITFFLEYRGRKKFPPGEPRFILPK